MCTYLSISTAMGTYTFFLSEVDELIEFPRIYAFCELAECLNFTEAAERLYTTQSSLSKTIAKFEEALGCQLFLRTNRSVELTPAGKYMYEYFKRTTTDMHEAVLIARQFNEGACGKLSFCSVGSGYAIPGIIPLLDAFREVSPEVVLSFDSKNLVDARNLLIANQIDLYLTRLGEVESFANCDYVTVRKVRPVLLIEKNHPVLDAVPEPTLKDLAECGFVTMAFNYAPRIYHDLYSNCKRAGFVPKDVKTVDNMPEILMEAAVNGRVAILDEYDADPEHYGLRAFPLPDAADIDIVFAWNVLNNNPQIARFIGFVRGYRREQ